MDIEDDATATSANPDAALSSSDDSNVPAGGLARGHGGRFRKRKLPRASGAASTASATSARKRGRRGEGGAAGASAGAAGARADGIKRGRLDWPSTVIPRTPYGVPLLLSCLSTYPDKVGDVLFFFMVVVVVCVWFVIGWLTRIADQSQVVPVFTKQNKRQTGRKPVYDNTYV